MIYFIYKIQIAELFYIGSTKNIESRFYNHKSCTLNGHNYKLYKLIRDNGGWENVETQILLKLECDDKKDALKKEEEFRKVYNASLNARKAYQTEEELNEYNRKYREDNRHIINENYLCNCGGRYTKCNYTHHLNSKKHINYIK